MTLDLFLLLLALVVGILGAQRGAASQLAGWGALVLGVLAARPGASVLGPVFMNVLHAAPGTAAVAAGFATFLVVLVVARLVLDSVLRALLTLGNPEHKGLDRAGGFVLGAGKVLAIAWVALSALAFVEERVSVSGKVLGVHPEDSLAFSAARRWNLFGLADFGVTQSLLKLEQALKKPGGVARLANDKAVAELLKNPRFKVVTEDPAVRRAVEQRDVLSLLKSDSVLKLLQDSEARGKLQAAVDSLRRNGPPVPGGDSGPDAK